jgi:pyrroloquinoline quinone biosynthesis protein B
VLEVLRSNRIFDALAAEVVERQAIGLGETVPLVGGLTAEIFPVPGKVPLYMEEGEPEVGGEGEATIGVKVAASDGTHLFYIPGCAHVTESLKQRIAGASLLFFDGTLWRDDEMIVSGVGQKTGHRMGHISMSGPDGSMSALADVALHRRVFIHINNTNPVLVEGSAERLAVEEAGWEVAHDGLEIAL